MKIEPRKELPKDPVEREKIIDELSKEGMTGSRKELEFLLKVLETSKKMPPADDFLIGKAA
jgi:hypothetical protein